VASCTAPHSGLMGSASNSLPHGQHSSMVPCAGPTYVRTQVCRLHLLRRVLQYVRQVCTCVLILQSRAMVHAMVCRSNLDSSLLMLDERLHATQATPWMPCKVNLRCSASTAKGRLRPSMKLLTDTPYIYGIYTRGTVFSSDV
jgi:hypothetical protein